MLLREERCGGEGHATMREAIMLQKYGWHNVCVVCHHKIIMSLCLLPLLAKGAKQQQQQPLHTRESFKHKTTTVRFSIANFAHTVL